MSFSGGRESLLTKEIESKLRTKTDELNEALESNSEVRDVITILLPGIQLLSCSCLLNLWLLHMSLRN